MPPLPTPSNPLPRIITYYQTHHDSSGKPISVLPFITQQGISLTHVIVAAIHLNADPANLTLNDHPPSDPRFQTLWAEMRILQASGIKVMGMLGGAAKGSYQRLDATEAQFERYYGPLKVLIRERGLDGLDLDVEEEMSLGGIIRLVDRLRSDFGPNFIITLAPVAAAMLNLGNLSGFDYEALEVMRGREIAWYNTQFYCGWGDISNPDMYNAMIANGWSPEKVVVGLVTNPANGNGFVQSQVLRMVLQTLHAQFTNFGGVMGWEYFNSKPGGLERPWEWAREMTKHLRGSLADGSAVQATAPVVPMATRADALSKRSEVDSDAPGGEDTQIPAPFDYYTDATDDE